MIMAIVTRRSDLLISKTAASIRRAINTNVVMVSGNDYFLISAVVMMMVMRDGRAANTNMVMVPRNNDLLVWTVVMMMMAGDGMNNILVMRGDSRGREITIVVHSPQATTITVMVVVMVMVAVVRCARIMNMVI